MNIELQALFNESWQKLVFAGEQSNHAFRTCTVANLSGGAINAYTVVLRGVEAATRRIIFYTDVRSEKVAELHTDGRISAVFYDHQEQCQLIVKGKATLFTQDETALHYFKKDGYKGRNSYLAQQAPSTPITQPGDGLEYLQGKQFDKDDMEGYENFAVIIINANVFEYLKLNRKEGKRRARFTLVENEWQGSWLIP